MIWSREAVISSLAVALLNSLWQGGVLGLVGMALSRRLKKSTPDVRCGAYSLLLFTMFAAWMATFWVHLAGSAPGQFSRHYGAAIGPAYPMLLVRPAISLMQPYYPLLTLIWAAGVIMLTLRHAGGFLLLHRLYTQATEPCLPAWNACARRLAGQMGIKRAVALRCSAHIDVPCVFWVLRSCILLPLGAMTRLSTDEVEALIAHELAHIARHDVLFNFIQVCIETILFYHPSTWWLSMQIRAAREERCDDLALRFVSDRTVYARALLSLEEARATHPQLALGAKGEKSTMTDTMFLRRIRRVLGVSSPDQLDPWAKTAAALGAAAVGLIALHPVHGAQNMPPSHTETASAISMPAPAANKTFKYHTLTDADISSLARRHPKGTILLMQAYYPHSAESTQHNGGLLKKDVMYNVVVLHDGKKTIVEQLDPSTMKSHNGPVEGKRWWTQSYEKIILDGHKYGFHPQVISDGHHKKVNLNSTHRIQAQNRRLLTFVIDKVNRSIDTTDMSDEKLMNLKLYLSQRKNCVILDRAPSQPAARLKEKEHRLQK